MSFGESKETVPPGPVLFEPLKSLAEGAVDHPVELVALLRHLDHHVDLDDVVALRVVHGGCEQTAIRELRGGDPFHGDAIRGEFEEAGLAVVVLRRRPPELDLRVTEA